MNSAVTSLAAGIMAMLLSLPGSAEPGVPPGGDCTLARDPLRCQALQQARSACKEKRGSGRQKCIEEKLSAPDCAKDKDRSRCDARQLAQEACKGKSGKARQSCLKDMTLAGSTAAPKK